MIPKMLHFIWLGDQEPDDFLKACKQSVVELHPGWEIKTHTDHAVLRHSLLAAIQDDLLTFWDVCGTCNGRHSPLAVQADLLRLCVLYVYGGIFLDHDLFGIQPLDNFLHVEPLLVGEIRRGLIAEAIIGTAPENPLILDLLKYFVSMRPILTDDLPHLNNVCMNLSLFCEERKIKAYPPEYFIGHIRKAPDEHRYRWTANTHLIHCWHRDFAYDLDRLREIKEQFDRKTK